MSHRSAKYVRSAVCTTGLLLLAITGMQRTAYAGITVAGSIKLVEGVTISESVKVVRAGYESIVPGIPGDSVFIGDTIKTGDAVKVKVELGDNTVMTAAPNSVVQITGMFMDRSLAKRKVAFKVLKGTVRFAVPHAFKEGPNAAETPWKASSVTIDAVSAVATVQGTNLIVTVNPADVEIAVLDGVVGVHSPQPDSGNAVVLNANEVSVTRKSDVPGPAESLAPERREVLVRRTTLDRGVADLAAVPARPQAARRFTENDVAREVAAGLTISEVIEKAVDSGMLPEEAVAAAIKSGVSADAVVYTAIQEGYSPEKVVEAAIVRGAPSALVFSAALAAGAERQLVIDGAKAAGMPPTAIAGSMASATSGDIRSTGPAWTGGGATPLAVLPLTPIPIGGGGGAPPLTEPASPYKP